MRLGVIGLGNIGGAVAANLVADGHEVTVFDLDAGRVAAILGATGATEVAEVAAATEVVLASLPTPDVVAGVAREWAAASDDGDVFVDLSTTAPATSRALAEELTAAGRGFVEAPLTGGAIGAQNRMLVFMVGGDDEAVARVRPLLDQLGRATFVLGEVGRGNTMKLVNSLIAYMATWSSLEGLALAAKGGIPVRTAVDVVRTAGATNFYIERGVDGLDTRGREAQFALGLAAKDASLIVELGEQQGTPTPAADAMRGVLEQALAEGLGDRDWSDLAEMAERLSGVELRIGSPPES